MRKKLGCIFMVIGLLCFIGFIVSMSSMSCSTSRSFSEKLKTDRHELNYVIVYGTVTAESDLSWAEITIRYYYEDSDVRHEAVVLLGELKKGDNEVRVITDIPWFNPDDPTKGLDRSRDERRPTIIEREAPARLTGLFVGLGFFFATAIFFVLGGMTAGGEIAFRRKSKSEPQPSIGLLGRPTRTDIDPFDHTSASPAVSRASTGKPKQKTDLASEISDVKAGQPRFHGREARFDALNYTAMVTVHAFGAEKFFYADPAFYDEVRDELQNSGKYKVYADPDINDFLFCCEMSRQEASWEDMLRVVCFDCYDDLLSSAEQRTLDRGKVIDVYKMLDKFPPDDMESFYAVYDRLPGETCASKYRSYRLLCGGESTAYVDSAARTKAKTVVQAAEPEPIVREVEPAAEETPVSIARMTVNRSQMLRRQTSAQRAAVDDGDGRESATTPSERERLAEAFWERLDKKTEKAFKRASLEEKAALFRDLPVATRPEVREGFYYAVYDELGGADETARRDRFERLLKGRFGT